MQQHPVPQNVTSYQFRLIGDMTLKQFLQLLGGGLIAFVFYSTNLINIVKWFFMFISVIAGVAFAFLPLEGRPLDQWLMAFIRAIYMPTQFYWKKQPKLPDYLSNEPLVSAPAIQVPSTKPTPSPTKPEDIFEAQQTRKIDEIIDLYHKTPAVVQPAAKIQNPTIARTPVQTITKASVKSIENISIQAPPPSNFQPSPISQKPQPPSQNQLNSSQPQMVSGTITPPPQEKPSNQTLAVFNPNLPFPSLPETPNTLSGMILDKSGNIIDGAVIEISTNQETVRATKSNRLGQFFLVTPLKAGSYNIAIDKTGFEFKTISLKLEDKVYPPLEIHANN